MKNDTNDKRYYVYLLTNSVNNKKYVGITSQIPQKRWNNGKGYKNTTYIGRAIEKYGWNKFVHEIIAENLLSTDAQKMECELINKYNTLNSELGYNIQPGGNLSNLGIKLSQSTRQKMSNSRIGKNNGFYGKTHNEKAKQILSEKAKLYQGVNHPFYGKHHSDDAKRKISESHKGRNGSFIANSEKVIRLDDLKIYESISLAMQDNLHCMLKGKLGNGIFMSGTKENSYFKYMWMKYDEYLKYSQEELKELINICKYNNDFRIVCLNNKTVYSSSTEVENVFNFPYLSRNKIRAACNSEKHIYRKDSDKNYFLWMYYKDYIKEHDERDLIYYQVS